MTDFAAPTGTSTLAPTLLFDTVQAYQRTAALDAAIELELFTAIAEGAADVPSLAGRCGASPRGVRMLCDYLTIIGFLNKTGHTYELTPESAAFLDKRSPAYLGGIIGFINSPAMMHRVDHLADTVRRGTVNPDESSVSENNPVWQDFARAMAPMMIPAAQAIAEILFVATAGPMRVLDIAAGHGMFGITIAQRNREAEIVAVDWEPVLQVAAENARRAGVADRHRGLAGDAFTIDFGGDFDVALLTNFLHHFDADTCTELLRKVAASVRRGGSVAVLEFVPNEDRVTPPATAAFVMNTLASTPSGDAYTESELRQMLLAAGFGDITVHPLHGPETVIAATRL